MRSGVMNGAWADLAARRADRLRVLADAVRTFADAAADYPRLLQVVARTVAETLRCFCAIGLVSADGRYVDPVASHDFDAAQLEAIRELVGAHPLPVDAPIPPSSVIRTGTPILVRDIDDAQIDARFPEAARDRAKQLAFKSYLMSPLKAHGKTLGLLSLVRHGADAASLDEEDAALAQSLADHAALAITNARSFADTKQATERLRLLAVLTREFAAATDDYDALLLLIARRLSEAFGDLCVIRTLSADGRILESTNAVYHPDPAMIALAQEVTAARPQRVGEGVSGRVAETGEPLLIPVVDTGQLLAGIDPDRRSAVERQRITSLVIAPLISRNRVIGVVSLSRSDSSRPYDENDKTFLQDVAAHAALTIVNARSLAAERASHLAAVNANAALHESEEAHRLLFEASPLPLFVFDVETLAPLAANASALALYGYSHDEFMKLKVTDLAVHGRDTARERLAAMGDAEAAGTSHYVRKDGRRLVADYTTRALTFGGRRARITVIKDVTERHEAEQARALLAAIVLSSNDAIVSEGLDGVITSWNDAAERLFGYSAEEAVGRPIALLIFPDGRDEEKGLLERIAAGERIDQYETVRRRKDGTIVPVSVSLAPVTDAAGRVVGASKTVRDLTTQRRAEDALRRTEEQLRQAQKMEAVGRLAGGIAHDFNNMLSVILSYCDIVLDDLKEGDPMRADIDEIRRSAQRAADLTRQLLVFSRQEVVAARVIDLNDVIAGMDKMLRRILGEDIDLVSVPAPHLGNVLADPSHVEQVIMNLVVNARDAMPTGGKLTIETANVELDDAYAREHLGSKPGPHVMLAVSDTGIGMDEATQARIFEPFFTTKETGKGTGLGLSTVFGIAQQAGGSVWVYSEPGKGTTFKIYLPRVERDKDSDNPSLAPVTLRGGETILLVEDQAQVRTVAHGILKRHGYRVIVAQNAGEALLLCETHRGTIHLLLTDVVMPHMSGAELAKRLARTRPDMKVLCMSGYTDDSIFRHGVLESEMAFLQKPFTPESLTRKVREVLNAPSTPRN
jgi:two-component system, cell cycle sensor histidine kinase and response regulator CckA